MGRAAEGVSRALDGVLGRCAGLVPPGRRTWVAAVRAEAGEVPAGAARVGWLAGGVWLAIREAGMVRRVGYGLAVVAVAMAAALAVRYVWSGALAGRDSGWDKARVVLLVGLLAGLPWVARRRGVFGPVGTSVAARAVRAGGCAALVALVLDFARVEHFLSPSGPSPWPTTQPWTWVQEGVAVVLIAACLTGVVIAPVRWPRARPELVAWCAVAAALVLFFTVAPLQVLIAVYAAAILAVTARRSPVTPATLAISAGTGVAGGLLVVLLWNPTRTAAAPGLHPKTDAPLLFVVLVAVIVAGTAAAGAVAARRARGTDDPVALQARAWQCLAAGPLTAASAAIMLPLLRASAATHIAAMCPATQALHPQLRGFHCTVAPTIWFFFLVAGPLIGLAIGTGVSAAISEPQPPAQPPRQLPPGPPPGPPHEPEPDGTRAGGFIVKI